jgi:DNA polymerase I-like protein with 3'-5' exonuclease and polymerase domains
MVKKVQNWNKKYTKPLAKFNLASPKQLATFCDKMKIGGTKQKKYGQYATGEEIFRVICNDNQL